MSLNLKDLEVRYKMFDHFALEDQRNYYRAVATKHRLAAGQVNRLRAGLSFLTGFAAASAAFIVQSSFVTNGVCMGEMPPDHCGFLQQLTGFFAIAAIALPALAAAFNTLADLYQWNRLITIYDAALENIEVADALSPDDTIEDEMVYRAALTAYAEGTLMVMSDETAQWGQAIRTPAQLEKYLEDAKRHSEQVSKITTQRAEPGGVTPPDNVPPTAAG